MTKEIELTERQLTIVSAIEVLMKEASYNDVRFVCDQYRHLYAYNSAEVSCFNAPSDAAYERKETLRVTDLHTLNTHVDYVPADEDIYVGMEAS